MDRFLRTLLTRKRKAVGLKGPTNSKEFLDMLECAMATLEISQQFRPNPQHSQPQQ